MLISHYNYMVLLPSSVILLTIDEDTVYEDHSKVRNRFVFVLMRALLSVTSRLMLLMLLDLFFTGVPNFPPPAKAVILRVGGERALLLTTNFSRP